MLQKGINRVGLGGLAFGHMMVDMQTSSLAVLVPLLYVSLSLDYAGAALIITLNSVTSALVQPLFGVLSDRKSFRWLLPVGCALTALGMVTVLFLPNYWLVLLMVSISGLGSAAFHPEGSRSANYVSGPNKASGMSVFFVGGNIGFALGPIAAAALIGIFGSGGIVGMLLPGLLGTLVLWRLMPLYTRQATAKPRSQASAAATRRSVAKPLSLLISVITVRSMIQTGLITFIPLYFLSLSTNNKDYAAFLLAVFLTAGAVGTLLGGRVADKIDRRVVMAGSLLVVTPMLLIFLNNTGIVQVVALAIAGATLISASSLTVVMAQEMLPNNVGLASGLTLGLAFGAGGLGASALGKYADVFGIGQTMVVLTFLPLIVVGLSLLLPGRKPTEVEPAVITDKTDKKVATNERAEPISA